MSIKEDVKLKELQTKQPTPEQVQKANAAADRAIAILQKVIQERENKRNS